MNLKEHINKEFGSQYRFSEEKKIKPSLVNYWCNKEWHEMQYRTRVKICGLLGLDESFAKNIMKTEHLDNRINELETLKSIGELSDIGIERLIEFKAIKKALIIDNVIYRRELFKNKNMKKPFKIITL